MEIEVPDRLQIGGFLYNVVCSPEEDAYLKERGWWGRYEEGTLTCSVRSDAGAQLMGATLIEEISHAIEVVYAGKQLDHEDLKDLAQGWFQVLEQLGVRLVKRKIPVA